MKKIILLSFLIVALFSCDDIYDEYRYESDSYFEVDWNLAADSASRSLVERFWNIDRHYFNNGNDGNDTGFGYWPQAHALEVLLDAYERTKDDYYKDIIEKWYDGVRAANGNTFNNVFYDDIEWNALAMLRVYEVLEEEKFLTSAISMWNIIEAGWNDYAGGGIAWKQDMLYAKNACSNGPAALVAIKLYHITQEEKYKEFAINIYTWLKNTLYDPTTGAIFDHINGSTGAIGYFSLTYNQGTFIGAGYELYKITKLPMYLEDAMKATYFTISKLSGAGRILNEEGTGDNALFKGIFIRYFTKLILFDELDPRYHELYFDALNTNAYRCWCIGLDRANILFSPDWNTPPTGTAELNAQLSGCMLIEARALLKNKLSK